MRHHEENLKKYISLNDNENITCLFVENSFKITQKKTYSLNWKTRKDGGEK